MPTRRYLWMLSAFAALGLALMAVVNLVVDPYASFRWHDLKGFNDQKHLKRGGGRVNKSVILDRHRFDVLFFGTSRTEIGLDPNSPALGGARAFNAAERSTNMVEMRIEALFAAARQTPHTVVIELDLLSFVPTDDLTHTEDYGRSLFAGRSTAPILMERLWSWRALADCATVVNNSRRHKPDPFTKFGYFDRTVETGQINHRQLFDLILREGFLAPKDGYRDFDYRPERVALLADILAAYRQSGARVLLFIAPLHARQLEAMAGVGLFPAFEQWKRDLTAAVAAANDGRAVPVRLWDFSGYNSITTEAVPDDPAGRMRWYWESSHYTKATGDLVLARLLDFPDPALADHADFGVELRPANVETALAAIRDGQERYRRDFPAEVAAVRRLVETAP